jgi:hypothetical protein
MSKKEYDVNENVRYVIMKGRDIIKEIEDS